jgi:histidinol-phosphate aminotransferase
MFNLDKLIRENIKNLKPYSSARSEYKGEAAVFLDANENPFNTPYNRYPDPLQRELKSLISAIKGIRPEQIFTGNGSDEAIDLVIRIFCEPGIDNIVSIDPTYGMYEVQADINNIKFTKISLTADFQLEPDKILSAVDQHTKIIFLCSPNNPTGNSFREEDILRIVESFKGIVVIDEAYIDFALFESYTKSLAKYPNLVIFQTLSKAWGLAGIRLGVAFAQPAIIDIFNKIKYPYNVNVLTQRVAIECLNNEQEKNSRVKILLEQRDILKSKLKEFEFVKKVYPTDANFILVKVTQPEEIYRYLVTKKIIVRNRNNVHLCQGGIRITVGTVEENRLLIKALKEYDY